MAMPDRLALTRANDDLRAALGAALAGMTDTQLHFCAAVLDERSLREIAVHAYRPVLAVVAIVVGEPWPPRPALPASMRALDALLDEMHAQIERWLHQVPPEVLMQPITVWWGSYASGVAAITGSLTHGLVHVGVMRGIRALGGFPCPPDGA